MDYINYLTKWIKDQVEIAGAQGVVVGISGGIDSAVTAALSKRAFPENVQGVIIPIDGMHDISDAQDVAASLDVKIKELDLTNTFITLKDTLQITNSMAIGNIKPRLRMAALYAIAQENNYLVIGTDNAAELLLGYFTKYGDGGVDLLPLANLRKEQVFEIAKKLGILKKILEKTPSAGLFKDQTDENELGVTYKEIDTYLRGEPISVQSKKIIENYSKKNQHKLIRIPRPNLGL